MKNRGTIAICLMNRCWQVQPSSLLPNAQTPQCFSIYNIATVRIMIINKPYSNCRYCYTEICSLSVQSFTSLRSYNQIIVITSCSNMF